MRRLIAKDLILSFVPDGEQRVWRNLTRMKLQLISGAMEAAQALLKIGDSDEAQNLTEIWLHGIPRFPRPSVKTLSKLPRQKIFGQITLVAPGQSR